MLDHSVLRHDMLPTFKTFKSTGEIRDTQTGTSFVHSTSIGISCHSLKCFDLGHSLRSPSKTLRQSRNACIHVPNSFPHFHKPSLSRPTEPCWSTIISVNYFVLNIFASGFSDVFLKDRKAAHPVYRTSLFPIFP